MLTQHRELPTRCREERYPIPFSSELAGDLHFSRSHNAQCANRSFIWNHPKEGQKKANSCYVS
jgi:hypothetical protein